MASIRKEKKKLKKALLQWVNIKITRGSEDKEFSYFLNGGKVHPKLTHLIFKPYSVKTTFRKDNINKDSAYGTWGFDAAYLT